MTTKTHPSDDPATVPRLRLRHGHSIPHLGLEHRAAWVEADRRGNIARMVSRAGFDPNEDADTAVLALFLAA